MYWIIIFNPASLQSSDDSTKWVQYGLDEIATLAQHFHPSDDAMLYQMLSEFRLLQYHIPSLSSSQIKFTPKASQSQTERCLVTLVNESTYKTFMSALSNIAGMALSMPVSNAWPERGANAMKRIKS